MFDSGDGSQYIYGLFRNGRRLALARRHQIDEYKTIADKSIGLVPGHSPGHPAVLVGAKASPTPGQFLISRLRRCLIIALMT